MLNTFRTTAPAGALPDTDTPELSRSAFLFSLFMQEIPVKPKMNDEKYQQNINGSRVGISR